jgi:hypothetical protein
MARTETYEHTINGLLQRRQELQNENAVVRERTAAIANDIEAIDRVLDSLGYMGDLEGRTARQARIILFYRNELREFLLGELRKAGRPMTTRELAVIICQVEAKRPEDRRLLQDVARRVSRALRDMRSQKMVVSQGGAKGAAKWSLA